MADRQLDVSRFIRAAPEIVWAWTEHAKEGFTPSPWTTLSVDDDLRPGGRADMVMPSPEGERHAYRSVVLEVEPGRRLVCTGAMTEGWVPQASEMNFVRIDTFEPENEGARYTAMARHRGDKAMQSRRDMGFEQGWGAAADPLAEVAERLNREDHL